MINTLLILGGTALAMLVTGLLVYIYIFAIPARRLRKTYRIVLNDFLASDGKFKKK